MSERSTRRDLLPWSVPLVVGVVVQIFVLGRIAGAPMTSYAGGPGAQFHAHAHRLWAWASIRDLFAFREGPLHTLFALDGDFPPLLHVATGVMIAPFGHTLNAAMVSGMVWVALLASSLGLLAARLSPRGGTDHVAGAAACTGVLLLASYQAVSFRYYFDVPMTALLWAGVAVLVTGWDREDRRVAVAAGLAFFAAVITKWTAVPFGGLMGLGLLWMARRSPPDARRRRVRAVLIGGTVAVGLSLAYGVVTALGPGESSFGSMFDSFDSGDGAEVDLLTAYRVRFYPMWIVRSIVSPALTLLALPLLALWLARGRVAWALVTLTALGQLAWLVASMPVLDERFALTAVPALVLAAALGFGLLPRPGRWILGPLIVAVGLAVCWDAHFGRPGVFSIADPDWRIDHWRKLGLENAWNADGAWTRGDATGQDCAGLREQMWDLVQRCEVDVIGIGEANAPLLGDGYWWSFKVAEHEVIGDRSGRERPALVVLNTWDGTQNARPPELTLTTGPAPDGLAAVQVGALASEDCPDVPEVAVWAPAPRPTCW